MIGKLKEIINWNKWAGFKTPILFMFMVYIGLMSENHRFLNDFFLFSFFIFIYGSSNHIINDYFDLEVDMKAGKKNTFEELDKKATYSLLTVAIGSLLLFGAYSSTQFPNGLLFFIVLILSLTLNFSYSIPPVRLKNRGILGIIAVPIMEVIFPVLLLLLAFDYLYRVDSLIILVYSILLGLHFIIQHQIEDYDADYKSSIKTYVVEAGLEKSKRIYSIVFNLEKITLFGLMVSMAYFGLKAIIPLIILTVIGWFVLSESIFSAILTFYLPQRIIPFYLAFLLAFKNVSYVIILIFLVLWFSGLLMDDLKRIKSRYASKIL